MPPTETKPNTLYLGLTMAGAVSAGAYTAGVMDYLIETLQSWHLMKLSDDPQIPQHKVVLDVVGGASAGGITSALAVLALHHGLTPVREASDGGQADNLLYDAWVNLADPKQPDGSYANETFRAMLATDDIKSGQGVPALLNSMPIDRIAERALRAKPGHLPEFIAPDLEVILSLFSLRGLRRDVPFFSGRTTDEPGHPFYLHKLYGHFKLGNQGPGYLPFDIHNKPDVERLIHMAKATSAFPLGLQSRNIQDFSREYLHESVNRFMPMDREPSGPSLSTPYLFTAVDGGTANNEPFGEIAQILTQRHPHREDQLAVIMIDPFPSFETPETEQLQQSHLLQIIPALVNALRQQVMVKEADIVRKEYAQISLNMIWPKRYDDKLKDLPNPIACGALGGFSGFFDRSFREHDFFLGRENCRRFLRFFFIREYDSIQLDRREKLHPVHQSWTEPMIKAFGQKMQNGTVRLPLIPDPFWMNKDKEFYKQYVLTKSPPFPSIPARQILNFQKDLDKRIEAILKGLQSVNTSEHGPISDLDKAVNNYLKKELDGPWLKKIFSRLGQQLAGLFLPDDVGKIIDKFYGNTLTKKALTYIVRDLAHHGLLNDPEFKK